MSTVLSFVQNLAERTGLTQPTVALSATDAQILQIVGLLEEACETLTARGPWEQMVHEATWVTTAAEDQGALTTLAPNGYAHILPNTLWDRTNNVALYIPVRPEDWQNLKAIALSGPHYYLRIQKGRLLVNPVPTAGYTWAFEYKSRYYTKNAAGDTFKEQFTADDDQILLPDTIVRAALKWRWREAKGLDYTQALQESEELVATYFGREAVGKTISMGEAEPHGPRVFLPAGNWITP